MERRKKKSLGYLPLPSLLWHYGLGSNVSLRCPLRGFFLGSTEYSCSKANRGHTWSQSTQKHVRQETQQSRVRYPSFNGSFCCSPCHNCRGTSGKEATLEDSSTTALALPKLQYTFSSPYPLLLVLSVPTPLTGSFKSVNSSFISLSSKSKLGVFSVPCPELQLVYCVCMCVCSCPCREIEWKEI